MVPTVTSTGCELWLQSVLGDLTMTLAPKPGRLEKISAFINSLVVARICLPAQASTLLGKCGFVGSQLQRRVLGFADRPLIERQYSSLSDRHLTPWPEACLAFILESPPPSMRIPCGGE